MLNNYMDTSHYYSAINNLMIDRMGTEEHVASLAEMRSLIKKLAKQVHTVDVAQLKWTTAEKL